MSLGGGADRAWLEPVTDKGSLQGDGSPRYDDLMGGHTGNTEGLNVENPQPGFVYIWERNTPRDLRRCLHMNKGELVVDGMEENATLRTIGSGSTPIDSTQVYQDVVLVRYPAEQIRRIREAEQKRAQAMLRSGSDEFLGKVTALEREMDPRGRGTRFTMEDHRLSITDDSRGLEIDSWTPDQGILNRK